MTELSKRIIQDLNSNGKKDMVRLRILIRIWIR